MAARTTKLELQQALATLGAEAEALRVEVSQLRAQLALRAAPKPARPAYVPPAPSAEQLARRAAMAAARELAMNTGVTVRVGA